MRLGGWTALAVGVAAAAAALAGPAVAGPAAPQATVIIQPGVQHMGHGSAQPPTTADCEAAFHVACYQPAQLQQAYNLSPLYARGVTGKGATIVIVDSFGSPT